MIERYYEDAVIRNQENSNKKKIRVAKTLQYVSAVLFVIMLILFRTVIPVQFVWDEAMATENGVSLLGRIGIALLWILPTIGAVGMFFIALHLRRKYTEEFDYKLQGDIFRIVRITNNSKRKLFKDIPVSVFERIGKIGTQSCQKAEDMVGSSHKDFLTAVVNYKGNDDIHYALLNLENKKILYFEPSEEMLRELRMSIGRDIMDKDESRVSQKQK